MSAGRVGSEGLASEAKVTLRYYLDEHVPLVIAEQLRVRGTDAIAAPEVGRAARAIPDKEQLGFAVASGRTFVTSDKDFIVLSTTCIPHTGIVLLQNELSIGQAIAFLELYAATTAPDEIRDQLRFCDW